MIHEERLEKIIEYLKENEFASYTDLMSFLGASRTTIRRDLLLLEKRGKLKSLRGGASAVLPKTSYEPPFKIRKDTFNDEKTRIAIAAAEMIQNNDTIILDSGTTVCQLAKQINQKFSKLYIATNDLNTAMILSDNHAIDLMVLGGNLRHDYYSLNGLFTENSLAEIHADKVFMGVDAVDLKIGLMNFSMEEVKTKRLMIKASNEVIILCDHSKFENIAFMNICSFREINMIITGREIRPDILKKLQNMNVNVKTV